MNLIFHQLRHEIRALRWLLIAWFAMLALELATNMGWPISLVDLIWNRNAFNVLMIQSTSVVVFLRFLLPVLLVHPDSPARRGRFLSTRPMPNRDLFMAKALFILLLIIIPSVGQEALHLTLKQLPPALILQGALERLVFVLPIVTISALLPFLCTNARDVILITLFLLIFAFDQLRKSIIHDYIWIIPVYLAVAGIVAIFMISTRYGWRPLIRAISISLWLLVVTIALQIWEPHLFPVQAIDQRAAQSAGSFEVPPFAWQIPCGVDSSNATMRVQPIAPAQFPGIVEWQPTSSELAWQSGQRSVGNITPHDSWNFGAPELNERDVAVFARLLGPQALFLNWRPIRPDLETQVGNFELKPGLLEIPTQARATFHGDVYRWEQTAVLPITANATAADSSGRWTCLGIVHDRRRNTDFIALRRDQIALRFSPNHLYRRSGMGFRYKSLNRDWAIVLYDSKKNLAVMPGFSVTAEYAVQSASPVLGIDLARDVSDPSDYKMVFFRKNYLGSVQAAWKSPEFTLSDFATYNGGNTFSQKQPMPAEEVERQLAQLIPPSTTASRVEVGTYLYEVLRLVQLHGKPFPPSAPAVAHVTTLVPAHLSVFLDGLPLTSDPSREFLISAVAHGAEESQKAQILSALNRTPDLVRVITARGWLQDARQPLYQLLQSPQHLSRDIIQAIATFEDPQTYPRLLLELETQPSLELYNALSTLPGINSALNQTVDRIWTSRPPIFNSNPGLIHAPDIEVALQHGKPEALAYVYRIIRDVIYNVGNPGNSWTSVQLLNRHVEIPNLPSNLIAQVQIFASYRPEDFRFDPSIHRFVLINAKPGKKDH